MDWKNSRRVGRQKEGALNPSTRRSQFNTCLNNSSGAVCSSCIHLPSTRGDLESVQDFPKSRETAWPASAQKECHDYLVRSQSTVCTCPDPECVAGCTEDYVGARWVPESRKIVSTIASSNSNGYTGTGTLQISSLLLEQTKAFWPWLNQAYRFVECTRAGTGTTSSDEVRRRCAWNSRDPEWRCSSPLMVLASHAHDCTFCDVTLLFYAVAR